MMDEKTFSEERAAIYLEAAYDEGSKEYPFWEMAAEWYKLFPDTPSTNMESLYPEGAKRLLEEQERILRSNYLFIFPDILKYDRLRKYMVELSNLCVLASKLPKGVDAFDPDVSHSERLQYFQRVCAIVIFNKLKKQYSVLNEFAQIGPFDLSLEFPRGSHKNILFCWARFNEKAFAIKYIPFHPDKESFLVEYVKKRKAIHHQAILPVKHVFMDGVWDVAGPQNYFCVATEVADNLKDEDLYMPLNLNNLIEYAGAVRISECIEILSPIADALIFLHQQHGCFHGNVSLKNILFFNHKPCLTDTLFHCPEWEAYILECKTWLPPEHRPDVMANHDIEGFGRVFYSLVSGLLPECYPRMPLEVMRQPQWKIINRFILRCCSSNKESHALSWDEFASLWEKIKCLNF